MTLVYWKDRKEALWPQGGKERESRENGIIEIRQGTGHGTVWVMKKILDFILSVMGDPWGC